MQEFYIVPTVKKILHVFIEDTRLDDGGGLTGLTPSTNGLLAWYIQPGLSESAKITLLDTILGTWTEGGFKEVDSADQPGWYELQLPDAVIAPSFQHSMVTLSGAINMAVTNIRVMEDQRRIACRYDPRVHAGASGSTIGS